MKQTIQTILDLLGRADPAPDPARTINGPTIGFLLDRMHFAGFHIREQMSTGPTGERINLLGRKGPPSGKPIWLVAQTGLGAQPVPAAWHTLDGAPTHPRRISNPNALAGFGMQSGRVDALLKILAAATLPPERLTRPIVIAAISGEEGIGSGAPLLHGTHELRTGTAIVHGPTATDLWQRHPGCLALQFELKRRVRHRRMPPHAGFWQFGYQAQSRHALAAEPAGADPDALAVGLAILERLRAAGEVRVLSFEAGETGNRVPARCFLRVATSYEEPPALDTIHPGITVAPIPENTALPMPVDRLLGAWFKGRDAGVAALEGRTGLARNARDARPGRASFTGHVASDRDVVSGTVWFWTGPGVDTEDLCERFAAAADAALQGEDEIEIELHVLHDRPAFDATEGNESLFAAAGDELRKLNLNPAPIGGLATTDAGFFRQHGLETLVFGAAGPIDALYHDDESLSLARLEASFEFYRRLLTRIASDGRG